MKEARGILLGFLGARLVFRVPEIISIPSFHSVERRDDSRRRLNFCSTPTLSISIPRSSFLSIQLLSDSSPSTLYSFRRRKTKSRCFLRDILKKKKILRLLSFCFLARRKDIVKLDDFSISLVLEETRTSKPRTV